METICLGAVEHLGGQLLPLGDDLLNGHRADDRAQVPREDAAGQHRHLVLVGQEPLAGVDDGLGVVADLERDDGADVERDALLGDAGLGDLGLPHGKRQIANLAEHRRDEGAVPGDDPERRILHPVTTARDEHRLIGGGNSVSEHVFSLS
jgi:hypothetical protein